MQQYIQQEFIADQGKDPIDQVGRNSIENEYLIQHITVLLCNLA